MALSVIASVLGSVSVLLAFAALMALRSHPELQQRVELYGGMLGNAPATLEEHELSVPFMRRVVKPLVLGMMRGIGSMMPNGRLAKVRQRLQLAGEPGNLMAAHFVGIQMSAC